MTATKVQIVEPGNATRYLLVTGVAPDGSPYVAIPNLNRAAVMGLHPGDWYYVAEKLDLGESDAKAIFAALNA